MAGHTNTPSLLTIVKLNVQDAFLFSINFSFCIKSVVRFYQVYSISKEGSILYVPSISYMNEVRITKGKLIESPHTSPLSCTYPALGTPNSLRSSLINSIVLFSVTINWNANKLSQTQYYTINDV